MNELYAPFQPTLTEAGLERFKLSLEYSPASKILRGVVHSYLQINAAKPTPYPIMPDGTQAVFVSPHGSKISGAQTQACDIQILQPGDYFGIRFHPGALRYFFDLNLSEISDQFVDSQYFPCRLFGELHKNIYRCLNFHERAQVCEQWLLRHFKPRPATQFDHALSLIYQAFGNIRIGELATMAGWSSRHLNRLFRLHTGLSTKTFAQTIRIQHVCKQLHITPRDSLNTALELGFFDQSHLIKDYKKRLLSNPSLYFERFMSDFYNS
jgi:AraC-like DNA-binding protein